MPAVLGAEFDLVYTGVGALNWLPDIAGLGAGRGRSAAARRAPLSSGTRTRCSSRWTTGATTTLLVGRRGLFRGRKPTTRSTSDTYTDGPTVTSPGQYQWNHGLGEIVQAVIDAGLTVTTLREHRECEWRALRQLVEGDDGKWRLAEGAERLPLMFTLEAVRS